MSADYFFELADRLIATLHGGEVLLCNFEAETSDFVRLNRNQVRQAGTVTQRYLHLDLIEGARHASAQLTLQGDPALDERQARVILETLRTQRAVVPDDPYLVFATTVTNTTSLAENTLTDSAIAIETIIDAAHGLDLVGFWASGTISAGFANSLGQRNWHESTTFNFDWSCYHTTDKAVKSNYAGFAWDPTMLARKMDAVRAQLDVIARPAKSITPGAYRAYFTPAALEELLSMMSWGGFGLKSHRTARTPLLKMVREDKTLHSNITLREDRRRNLAPSFTSTGFVATNPVTLIDSGRYRDCLVSPRSAKEYDVAMNSGSEAPQALDLTAGDLHSEEILREMGTGLYLNNLWYCNFSDRDECRITGMTRFACFWVENGVVQAPLNVMRFDDSMYRVLGTKLRGLTREREFLFDTATYGARSTRSALLPGALVDEFMLTL